MSVLPHPFRSDVSACQRGCVLQEDLCPMLKNLEEHAQLRHYRTRAPSPVDDDGVTSSFGVPASEANKKDLAFFPPRKRAAVLVCIYSAEEGIRVILRKRALPGGKRLRYPMSTWWESGEVALPGGMRGEEDVDDAATALREAHEEIGLLPSQVRVIAWLEPFLSKNLLTVMPVVGLLDDDKTKFVPVPNPGEVDAIFDAPLEMFLKDENYWSHEREWLGNKYRVHFFDYTTADGDKYLVWGLTASILIRVASILYQRKPIFQEFAADLERMVKH